MFVSIQDGAIVLMVALILTMEKETLKRTWQIKNTEEKRDQRVNQEVFDLESVLHKGKEHRGTNMLGQREKKDDNDVSWS